MKRARWIIAALIAVLLIAVIGIVIFIYDRLNSDVPELEPVDGDLAFVSDRSGTWDIFILQQDGMLRNITPEGDDNNDDYMLNFTFKGDMVYFYTNRTGDFSPGRVKLDGSDLEAMSFMEAGVKAMTSGHLDADPRWSPDGIRVVWVKTRNFAQDICLATVGNLNDFDCLTSKEGNNSMASWSPDGSKIAYVTDRNKDQQNVYVVTLASGEHTRLTDDEVWDFQPSWSLDGSRLLYISDREDHSLVEGRFDLYLVTADASEQHAFAEGEQFEGAPAYSPSGKQVAYMSNESGTWQIYVMDTDGSNVRRVTDGEANNMFPAWVPKAEAAG